jgi:hypothetical protein
MNPLIEKYEEVYGKKPVEDGLIEQLVAQNTININNHLPGGMGNDVISLGGNTMINSAYVSNDFTTSSVTKYNIPCSTEVDKQFGKVLDDLSNNKAVVESIKSDIDASFTGFGGQIRYIIEIVSTYP